MEDLKEAIKYGLGPVMFFSVLVMLAIIMPGPDVYVARGLAKIFVEETEAQSFKCTPETAFSYQQSVKCTFRYGKGNPPLILMCGPKDCHTPSLFER